MWQWLRRLWTPAAPIEPSEIRDIVSIAGDSLRMQTIPNGQAGAVIALAGRVLRRSERMPFVELEAVSAEADFRPVRVTFQYKHDPSPFVILARIEELLATADAAGTLIAPAELRSILYKEAGC